MAKSDKWPTDAEGNILDPPIIPEHEARVAAAANSGDNIAVQIAQEDYDEARKDYVKRYDKRREAAAKTVEDDTAASAGGGSSRTSSGGTGPSPSSPSGKDKGGSK